MSTKSDEMRKRISTLEIEIRHVIEAEQGFNAANLLLKLELIRAMWEIAASLAENEPKGGRR